MVRVSGPHAFGALERLAGRLQTDLALFDNRLALQGETRSQSNNLEEQRAARTDRATHNAAAVLALSPKLTTSFAMRTVPLMS